MDMDVLRNMALFDFIIGGSTGEKTTSADDFERMVGRLLPKGTFTWISKFRTQAKRELLKVGTARKVDNRVRGYFVPMDFAPAVSEKLKAIKGEYLKEKASFLDQLPTIVEAWANHPENQVVTSTGALRSDLIRTHAPNREELDRLLNFSVSSVMINPTTFFGADDALNEEVGGLAGQAAGEIAEDVKKSWKGCVGDRTTSRVLGLIRRIRQKAAAMGVLSTKFENLERICNAVLARVPSEGTIDGTNFIAVSQLLTWCSTPGNILAEQAIQFDPLEMPLPAATAKAEEAANAAEPAQGASAQPQGDAIAAAATVDAGQLDLVDLVASSTAPADAAAATATAQAASPVDAVSTAQVMAPTLGAQDADLPGSDIVLEF